MLTWVKNNRFSSRILIVKLLLAFCVFTLYPLEVDAGRVKVRGYYRKDGTYVRPHYRTAPDGNPYNNYSFPGNYNPNTGRITPGNPQTYLDRYYNRSSSSYSTPSIDYDKWLKDWEVDLDKQLKDWEADLDKQLKDWEADLDKQLKDFEKRLEDLRSGSRTGGDVNVQGYFRKDGTYVAPHFRTAPDGDPTNNYSYPGNYNPNTGKITSGYPFKHLWRDGTHTSASSTSRNITGAPFTVGSTMKEVIAVQGTPKSFTDTQFDYGNSTVYFQNGRVTRWYISSFNSLKAKYPTTYTNKTHFTIGSTREEVAAIQGTPKSFTDTQFDYGNSTVYFQNGRVTRWYISSFNSLKAKYPTTYTNKTHFTIGSTREEVAAIQGTPKSFTDTQFDYGNSTVYFQNGRVTRWYISSFNSLKAKYPTTYTNKTHFTIGSTREEVAAIQGTPKSFTDTQFDYGNSTVYFQNGRVTRWYISSFNSLKAKYPTTYTNKTHFTIGSTREEVAAIQGTPKSFTDTQFDYGNSTVYFQNGRVTRWYISSFNPLKAR